MRQGYKVKPNEKGLVHVEFIQIRMVGDETQRFPKVQMFHPREWDNMKRNIDELGLKGTTMQSRVEVLYDPRVDEVTAEKPAPEVKQEAKPKGRPPKKVEEK